MTRSTDASGVFSINNIRFQVQSDKIPPKSKLIIRITKHYGIQAIYKDITSQTIPLTSILEGKAKSSTSTVGIIENVVNSFFYSDAKAS